jgi:hypothetical protein
MQGVFGRMRIQTIRIGNKGYSAAKSGATENDVFVCGHLFFLAKMQVKRHFGDSGSALRAVDFL